MKLYLKITDKNKSKKFGLEQFPFTIGRSREASAILEEESISLKHAHIVQEEGTLIVEDLQSTNGLFYKGKKIDRLPLEVGMVFFLGPVRVELHQQESLWERTKEIHLQDILHLQQQAKIPWILLILSFLLLIAGKALEIPFLNPLNRSDWSESFFDLLINLSLSLLFATILAIVSKIHQQSYKILNFIIICNFALASLAFYSYLYPYFFQIFFLDSFIHQTHFLGPFIIIFIFLLLLAKTLFGRTPFVSLFKYSGIVFLLIVAVVFWLKTNEDESLVRKYTSYQVYPVIPLKLKVLSVEKWDEELKNDFIEVQQNGSKGN